MIVEIIDEVEDPEREDEDIEPTGPIIWNYFKVSGVQSKSGRAKNVTCNFCDTVFVGCSSSRAFAHILGRPVLGQKNSNSTIASFIFENALSFNVVDSPSFAVMVDQCIQFGQQNPGRKYKVPTRRRISGPLLDSAYEDTAGSVKPIMDRAKKYGGTLTSDGWSDVQRRPITNFMLVTRESYEKENAAYLAEQIIDVIREIGAENIVQVIMDGANKAC